MQMLHVGSMMSRTDRGGLSSLFSVCMRNGLALGDAEDGKTATIRTQRCSMLCLQKAKVHV